MRLYQLIPLLGVALLTGCASDPPVDTSRWTPEQIARHNAGVDASNEAFRSLGQQRPTPVIIQSTPGTQPSTSTTGEQYQTVMVNTPSGMVYKRCKVLNGKAVACF